jgi:SAM-dependent methyltransferase
MEIFKKRWFRVALHGERQSHEHSQFNRLYLAKDPWGMKSPREEYRFEETTKILLHTYGKVNSLLEIGCGEGHQSIHLQNASRHLTGLDVSARAIKRARRKCPGADFIVGDVFCSALIASAPYDLIVACEVLYYMPDIVGILRQMRKLASNIFVTYFSDEMARLDPIILTMPGCTYDTIQYEESRWRIACL